VVVFGTLRMCVYACVCVCDHRTVCSRQCSAPICISFTVCCRITWPLLLFTSQSHPQLTTDIYSTCSYYAHSSVAREFWMLYESTNKVLDLWYSHSEAFILYNFLIIILVTICTFLFCHNVITAEMVFLGFCHCVWIVSLCSSLSLSVSLSLFFFVVACS